MITWQVSDLSIADPETGSYIEDVLSGVPFDRSFDLAVESPGDTPVVLTIDSARARLWRYRQPAERTAPTVAPLEAVGDWQDLTVVPASTIVTVTVPALDPRQQYQLVLEAHDSLGKEWGRTREFRVPA